MLTLIFKFMIIFTTPIFLYLTVKRLGEIRDILLRLEQRTKGFESKDINK